MKTYCTLFFLFAIILLLFGCSNKKNEQNPSQESLLLQIKQVAEQFNAKIVNNDIEKFKFTYEFQEYFSDKQQNFVFVLSVEDILKRSNTIEARFSQDSTTLVFLEINKDMLQIIEANKQPLAEFIVVATIDKVKKPFLGLNGQVDDFEIVDTGTEEDPMPTIEGDFYIEVVDAPLILHGKCVFLEPVRNDGQS